MKNLACVVVFFINLEDGSRAKVALITTPRKGKSISKISRKIRTERAVLRRAFSRMTGVQRKTVAGHLSIKTANEELLDGIISVIK